MARRASSSLAAGQAARVDVSGLLVAVARDHFAELGYADTSLASVVSAAGITKGAVYYHFANKQDLFAARSAGRWAWRRWPPSPRPTPAP